MYWFVDMWLICVMLFILKVVLWFVMIIIFWNSIVGKGKRKIERYLLVLFWYSLMSNFVSFVWFVVFGRNKGGFMIYMFFFKVLLINYKGEWFFWERSIF